MDCEHTKLEELRAQNSALVTIAKDALKARDDAQERVLNALAHVKKDRSANWRIHWLAMTALAKRMKLKKKRNGSMFGDCPYCKAAGSFHVNMSHLGFACLACNKFGGLDDLLWLAEEQP